MSITEKIAERLWRRKVENQALPALADGLRRRRGVAILCYHTLSDDLADYPYRTRADAFDKHLSFLADVFDIVSPEKAVGMIASAATHGRPIAAVTFDDGFRDNLTVATPILERHGVPATLFAARSFVHGDNATFMSEKELVSLARHGLWQVGAHSMTHTPMYGLLDPDLEREVTGSRDWLADLLGERPSSFAYPQGKISDRVVSKVRAHFDTAFAVTKAVGSSFDRHRIGRICPTRREDEVTALARQLTLARWEGAGH